ncbi:MAG: hypothetical protein VCB59_05060, partial [Gammaproteobacteria bacterium]
MPGTRDLTACRAINYLPVGDWLKLARSSKEFGQLATHTTGDGGIPPRDADKRGLSRVMTVGG